VVGVDGIVLRTANGGQRWRRQTTSVQKTWRSVVAITSTEGWIAGEDGILLQTLDGGQSWQPKDFGCTQNLLHLFARKRQIWICGAKGTISRQP